MIFQTKGIITGALCISFLLNIKISHSLPDVSQSEGDKQQFNEDEKRGDFEMETNHQTGEDLGNVSQVLITLNQKLNGLEAERIRQISAESSKQVDRKVTSLNRELDDLKLETIHQIDEFSKNVTQSTNTIDRRLEDLEIKTTNLVGESQNITKSVNTSLNRRVEDLETEMITRLDAYSKNIQSENSLVHRFDYLENKTSEEAVEYSKNLTDFVNSINHKLEELEMKITEESRRRQYDKIVQDIKSERFLDSAQKLKQADYGSYNYTVREVYNNRLENVELLRRFWQSINDIEIKNNFYQALIHEVKVHNLIDGQSLSTWSIFGDEAPNLIVESIQKDGPVIHLAHLKCFQCMVDIGEKVIRKIWGNLTLENVMQKARNKLKNVEEQIAIQTALFRELESRKALYTNDSVILARHMKFTAEDAHYNSVSLELKSQHEAIKNKLPLSMKNLIFSSTVCMKDAGKYLYADTNSDDTYLKTAVHYAHHQRLEDGNKSSEFKWHVSFETPDLIYIRNDRYNKYLTILKNVLRENVLKYAVVGHGNPLDSIQWHFDVFGDNIKIHKTGLLVDTKDIEMDGKVRYMFTYRPDNIFAGSDWQILDCS